MNFTPNKIMQEDQLTLTQFSILGVLARGLIEGTGQEGFIDRSDLLERIEDKTGYLMRDCNIRKVMKTLERDGLAIVDDKGPKSKTPVKYLITFQGLQVHNRMRNYLITQINLGMESNEPDRECKADKE